MAGQGRAEEAEILPVRPTGGQLPRQTRTVEHCAGMADLLLRSLLGAHFLSYLLSSRALFCVDIMSMLYKLTGGSMWRILSST